MFGITNLVPLRASKSKMTPLRLSRCLVVSQTKPEGPFHSQDLKANPPNGGAYITLLASLENLLLYQDHIVDHIVDSFLHFHYLSA